MVGSPKTEQSPLWRCFFCFPQGCIVLLPGICGDGGGLDTGMAGLQRVGLTCKTSSYLASMSATWAWSWARVRSRSPRACLASLCAVSASLWHNSGRDSATGRMKEDTLNRISHPKSTTWAGLFQTPPELSTSPTSYKELTYTINKGGGGAWDKRSGCQIRLPFTTRVTSDTSLKTQFLHLYRENDTHFTGVLWELNVIKWGLPQCQWLRLRSQCRGLRFDP